jgi:CelD/BcsL family acetyltransferase involved in cellulose biosynthesis
MSEFVGGSWALLADALVAPGEEASATTALVERAASSGHDFANLFGLPESSRLVAALPPDALCLVERLEAPVLDLDAGWDAVYAAKIPAKARSERRRRRRQLESLGTVEVSVARTREELESALEDAYRVYDLRWQGRRDPSGFITPVGQRFHRAALLRLAELDVPRLVTIRLDGRAIAFALSMHLAGRAYGITMAFDPAYARFSPGSEAKLVSLETAGLEGITRVELLGAAAGHKQRFTDRFEPIYQGIGLARTLRGHAAVETLVGGIRIRRAIKRSRTAHKLYYRVRVPKR